VEPTLAIIGLNYRTSPVSVREQFWIPEPARYEALQRLLRSEGIEEIVVLATFNRTEFILWANDVPAAANSVLRFLTQDYHLRLCDWSHFYRLMDDVAFTHLFQVAAGLDSVVIGEPETAIQLREALEQACTAGATGRFLDSTIQKALAVSSRVRAETAPGDTTLTFPYAAVELAMEVLEDLSDREVLLLGAGRMSEMAARCLRTAGANRITVMNRTYSRSEELANQLDAKAAVFDERLEYLKSSDVVICSTTCPQNLITLDDARRIARTRQHKPLVMIDMAVPRNIDPRVDEIDGVYLFNIDNLEEVVSRDLRDHKLSLESANRIIADEVAGFRRRLAERVVPTIVALRQRLEELCQQEVEYLRQEFGPFTADQDQVVSTLASHITLRIVGALARELREVPDRTGQNSDLAVEAGRKN